MNNVFKDNQTLERLSAVMMYYPSLINPQLTAITFSVCKGSLFCFFLKIILTSEPVPNITASISEIRTEFRLI